MSGYTREMHAAPTAIVVGAGIAGLTAGFRLQQAGFSVRVLEAEAIVGGRMSSIDVDGFVMNRGAGIVPGSYKAIAQLAVDVGLGELARAEATIGIVRNGTIHRMETAHLGRDGIRTKLLSWKCKLRMAKLVVDAARIGPKMNYERIDGAHEFDVETASAYAARRLGDEARRYVVEPVVRGASSDASVVEYFFVTANLLGTGFLAYPGRMGFLAEALAAKLDVTTQASALSIAHEGERVRVTWRHEGAEHAEVVDACVLAVPGELVPGLYRDLDARAATILSEKLRYGTVYVGHFGLSAQPSEPAGLVMIPAEEDPGMYAIAFDHHLRPAAVQAGRGQLTTYWCHEWCVANSAASDDELIERMLPSIEKFVPNVRSLLRVARVDRWPRAAVQSYPGYCSALAGLNETLDPRSPVQLAGDYFASPSTNAAAVSGERAAKALIARAQAR
jgi:oxygen-dependent protoporphyrinogen oxidase